METGISWIRKSYIFIKMYCSDIVFFSGVVDEANKIPTFSPYSLINLSGWILSHYFLMLKQNELIEIFLVKHLIPQLTEK